MKANMKEGLPLRLVNSHDVSQLQRKLLPCKCKWQTIVIENELNAQDKGHIIGPFAYDDHKPVTRLKSSNAPNKRDPKF